MGIGTVLCGSTMPELPLPDARSVIMICLASSFVFYSIRDHTDLPSFSTSHAEQSAHRTAEH